MWGVWILSLWQLWWSIMKEKLLKIMSHRLTHIPIMCTSIHHDAHPRVTLIHITHTLSLFLSLSLSHTLTHTHTHTLTGTVTMWSPSMKAPLVKMLCHRGPITGIAIDTGGWCMATVAMDARLKIWDIRSTYK